MDSVLENMRCLQSHIEVVREHMHRLVMQGHREMIEEEVIQLSQLLDEYIVYYTKGQKFIREGDYR